MKIVLKNLKWIFILSLIVLRLRRRNSWNLTTSFHRPYRILPAEPAWLPNQAGLAGWTLYGQGKSVVRFQKFLLQYFEAVKLSIKIHTTFLGTIFIHFDLVGTQCLVHRLMWNESSWGRDSRHSKGSYGLEQLRPNQWILEVSKNIKYILLT